MLALVGAASGVSAAVNERLDRPDPEEEAAAAPDSAVSDAMLGLIGGRRGGGIDMSVLAAVGRSGGVIDGLAFQRRDVERSDAGGAEADSGALIRPSEDGERSFLLDGGNSGGGGEEASSSSD